MQVMDNRAEIRDFLATRRAKVSPEQAGVPLFGGRRRVPGLRREEVALLAGVSVDYYTRLEKGHLQGASETVLDAIADALRLNDAERDHLHNLARAARSTPRTPRRRPQQQVRPSLIRLLDSMVGAAAFIRNARLDILAVNNLGRAVFAPVFRTPVRPANMARFNFLDPAARQFYPDWDTAADTSVALLRTAAGRDPLDKALTDLIGELATRSDAFRTRWGHHDVRAHRTGVKHFNHPEVGLLDIEYDSLDLPGTDLTLTAYSAEPESPTAEKLALLASWHATDHGPAGDGAAERAADRGRQDGDPATSGAKGAAES